MQPDTDGLERVFVDIRRWFSFVRDIIGSLCDMTEYFEYLDDLRGSGVTNMFGAGIYLERYFGLSKPEAHKVLGEWMRTFKLRHPRKDAP